MTQGCGGPRLRGHGVAGEDLHLDSGSDSRICISICILKMGDLNCDVHTRVGRR